MTKEDMLKLVIKGKEYIHDFDEKGTNDIVDIKHKLYEIKSYSIDF